MTHSVGDVWLWGMFIVLVGSAFFIDLRDLVRDKEGHMSLRHALSRSAAWVGVAFLFLLILWFYLWVRTDARLAADKSAEFLTAYLIEKSLSFDNLFVILMIFRSSRISEAGQRRVLFWGVLGAAVLRFIAIFGGIWLINLFHWLMYIFGFFIFYTGLRMFFQGGAQPEDPTKGFLFRWISRHIPVSQSADGRHFFVHEKGRWHATPLLFALVMVELSDLIFAVDSVPAVFAITLDPFLAFSSNLLAVLGLRALYFVLAHAEREIEGLHVGIALVLMLTGFKMLADKWIHFPSGWMLLLVAGILLAAGGYGWWKKKRMRRS